MKPAEPLPDVPVAADSFKSDTQCSAAYVDVAKRLTALQGWTATVLSKK